MKNETIHSPASIQMPPPATQATLTEPILEQEPGDTAFADLQEVIAELRQHAGNVLHTLHGPGGLTGRLHSAIGFAGEHLSELSIRTNQTVDELAGIVNEIPGLIAEARAPMGEIQDAVRRVTDGADEVLQEFENRLGALDDVRDTAVNTCNELLALIDDRGEEFGEEIDALVGTTVEAVEGLVDSITSVVEDTVLKEVEDFCDTCVAECEQLLADITEKIIPEWREDFVETNLEEVREQIRALTGHIEEGLEEFRETIFGRTSDSASSRVSSDQAMEMLKTAFAPVTAQLDRVRDLASMVGISI